jgi:CPA2 family monovalent cation:H+ antiporter-2
MEIPLLRDIVIILLLAAGVVFLSHRLRLPLVVGLLLTGVFAGPHALGLISAHKEVEQLAKIGVILLLFTIGIEFSLRKLLRIKLEVLAGGGLQVLFTVAATALAMMHFAGLERGPAIFMGFLVSLSSTAIVLKLLQDRGQMETPQGRLALGALIFQDVIVVFFIILTPALAGRSADAGGHSLLQLGLTGAGLLLFVFLGSRHIIPAILHQTVRTRSRELLLITIGGICLAVAWAASSLSLALGAFLAGLTISESEYNHEAYELIRPFRDLFTAFFFVSIGMLLDVGFILAQPLTVLGLTLLVLLGKALLASLAAILIGYSVRNAVIAGLILSQVGEFAFILSGAGKLYGLLPPSAEQLFLAVSVLGMGLTGFLIQLAPGMASGICKLPMPQVLRAGYSVGRGLSQDPAASRGGHVVIVGYGVNGRNVAQAVQLAGMDFRVVEMNPDTVRTERGHGLPILYGDATREDVLLRAGIREAESLVVVIADAAATRQIVSRAREQSSTIHIVARTRFSGEVEALIEEGADEVIPEEFETSLEIFARVANRLGVKAEDVSRQVESLRAEGYSRMCGGKRR